MKFCSVCSNMYYISIKDNENNVESKDDSTEKLYYYCRKYELGVTLKIGWVGKKGPSALKARLLAKNNILARTYQKHS